MTLHLGDCLEVLRTLPENSVDSIVTDPPYGLKFMGKKWDYGVPGVEFWNNVLRVLKPGGHLLAFGGTRTYHRLAVAIEDAGFEVRDCIMWVYGSGFPKSLDVGKAIDKAAGAEREVVGSKVTRIPGGNTFAQDQWTQEASTMQAVDITAPATDAAKQWDGWGTALKPSYEPIIVARKPLQGTVAANTLKHGCGGINVDGCRIGTEDMSKQWDREWNDNNGELGARYPQSGREKGKQVQAGRWPANLIHDGSEEVLGLFPETTSGSRNLPGIVGDTGSAARFFKDCKHEPIDLLFCRATAILSVWNHDLANTADTTSTLSSELAVSALSCAVTAASLGVKRLSDAKGLSTSVTPSELRKLCESLIALTLSVESEPLPGLLQGVLIPNGCLVSVAVGSKPTGITTITISPPTSGGSAAPVTFSITPSSTAHGEAASRFRYCAKASKADRDEGCEGLDAIHRANGNKWTDRDYRVTNGERPPSAESGPRRNHHPTVKPTALMRYLCRLVTPPGGTVLDPFMGSGSTGKAARAENLSFIGIEINPEYHQIATARIHHHQNHQPTLFP